MKILYFHQHFSTPEGATGIRSYFMAQALIAKGHQVTMVCGSYQGGSTGLTMPFNNGVRRGTVDGIDVIEFELEYANQQSFLKRTSSFLKFAWRSIKVTLNEQYDLIFATTTPLTAAIPGIFGKVIRRKPFVFEVRDLWPELPKAMGVIKNPVILFLMKVLEWLAYKVADGHIALSPGIQQGIEQHLSQRYLSQKEVCLVPNGCDLTIFDQQTSKWQPEAIQDTDFVAVFSGTHGIANDLHKVLDTAQELIKKQQNHIKIVLIGQGKQKDELITRAKQQDLVNVLFLDPVNKSQLAQLMERADVGLQVLANIPAFYYGTSPNKFFDYIAAGLPVVNNYPGWVADIISSHNCGIAVSPENSSEFAHALTQLANNKGQLLEMSQNAKTLAKSQFSRDLLAEKFVTYIGNMGAHHV